MKELSLKFYYYGFQISLFHGEKLSKNSPIFRDKDSLHRGVDLIKEVVIQNKNNIFLERGSLAYKADPSLAYYIDNYIVIGEGTSQYIFHFNRANSNYYHIYFNHLLNIIDEFSKKYI